MAENLAEIGLNVTIAQRGEHLLNTLDYDMASFVHATFRNKGLRLMLNSNVKRVEKVGDKCIAQVNDEELQFDIVIIAIGVVPENTLAKKLNLELGEKGAIIVNDKMQTSVEDIYAVGDAVCVKHYITGKKAVISLAGPANKQGRIVADNVCDIPSTYKGSQGSSVIKIFDMTVASTGLNEKALKSLGIDYEKIILSPSSHAGYYPNASVMTIKLIYKKNTLDILGAQIVGYDGVDKRIDVIATAIRGGIKAPDLKDLDLCYAPPYSSAKDPVNMAGFIADNIENGIVKNFHYEEIENLRKRDDVILLDTRTVYEYSLGHAEGFVNIPLDSLRERYIELDNTKKIYVMCQSGIRSYLATRILAQKGYETFNFLGGFRLYNTILTESIVAKSCYSCGMDK